MKVFSSTTRTRSARTTSSDSYLAGQYESGKKVDGIQDFNPNRDTRNVRMEDGIMLPRYRLPTEAEWEFAAYGLVGNTVDERIVERRVYPWNGHFVRYDNRKKAVPSSGISAATSCVVGVIIWEWPEA